MNDEQQTWESTVTRVLDQRVSDLHDAPITLEQVQGRARTLRRRRRVAVAGGVLAAAAVLAPVALLASGVGEDRDTAPAGPGPSAVTEGTRATDPNPPDDAVTGPPRVPYLEGTTWHRPDGSVTELEQRYDRGTLLGENLLAVRVGANGSAVLDVVTPGGEVVQSTPVRSDPVVSTEHTTAAWVGRSEALVTLHVDGDDLVEVVLSVGLADGDSVAAVTGEAPCDSGDCTVYLNHGDLRPAEVVDVDRGVATPVSPRVIKVNDATDDGTVAAQTSYSADGSCSAVAEAGGEVRFETCRHSFYRFSPDGAHLSATDAYRDGLGPAYISILDAAGGAEVARLDAPRGGFLGDPVWEDDRHLLVPAYVDGTWQVHRLGVDGHSEQVLGGGAGDDVTPAFVLLGPA